MEKLLQSRPHDEALIASFRDDPEYAAVFLNAVLEDGDQEELLEAGSANGPKTTSGKTIPPWALS